VANATYRPYGFNQNLLSSGYTYDTNGNLKTDSYKGITNIVYNHLNLPSKIKVGLSTMSQRVGNKLINKQKHLMRRMKVYLVCSMLNLILCGAFLLFWFAGSHGKIQLRLDKFEDWLFLSAALPWLILSIIFLILAYKKYKHE
jgi:hypothetical protein